MSFSGLIPSTVYTVQVRAQGAEYGFGDFSDSIIVTTLRMYFPISTFIFAGQFNFFWKKVAGIYLIFSDHLWKPSCRIWRGL